MVDEEKRQKRLKYFQIVMDGHLFEAFLQSTAKFWRLKCFVTDEFDTIYQIITFKSYQNFLRNKKKKIRRVGNERNKWFVEGNKQKRWKFDL